MVRSRVSIWLTLVLVSPLIAALCTTIWRAPFPISETVALMEGAGVGEAGPVSLDNPTLRSFYDPTSRSWYRPFYHSTWYVFWHATHSLGRTLFLFKALEVGAILVLVALFVRHLRVQAARESIAAAAAVAVLVATPAFRENLEVPLLFTLVGMPLMLGVWTLLESRHRTWHVPAVVALTALAVGFKEQGLIIVPLVVAAWWFGAPGATRGMVAALVISAAAYLTFRLVNSGAWGAFEQDFSYGFTTLPAAEASARFGAFPLPMYLYNGVCTVLNVLLSEPGAGRFRTVESLVYGTAQPWQIVNLSSSACLTVLIGWWGVRTWRENGGQPWSYESRVVAAALVTLVASAPLGFNYTRDRLGGMAAVFYAMAAYFAIRMAMMRMESATGLRRATAALALCLLTSAWQLRAIGTLDAEHQRATRVRREWMTDLQARRIEFAHNQTYIRILNAMVKQGLESDAGRSPYPASAARFLGEP